MIIGTRDSRLMPNGGRVKGVLPAGASAPILTADKLDTKLDYDSVQAAGSMLGSASLIVLPVVRIDGRPVGNGAPGTLATALRKDFHRYAEWD